MTATALKLLALALMLLDHIGEFLPGIPLWFRLLGRLSAPLFFFCAAWGFHYTRDRKKHLLRLYLFGVLMAVLDLVLNLLAVGSGRAGLPLATNNIFVTLLLVGIVIGIYDAFREDRRRGLNLLLGFAALQIVSAALCLLAERYWPGLPEGALFCGALLPSLWFNEGGPAWVLLGLLFYLCKEDKRRLAAAYSAFCLAMFALALANGLALAGSLPLADYLFRYDYQWLMIGALPFLLLYNGKRGAGLKYLFYVFYPLHIAALFLLRLYCF